MNFKNEINGVLYDIKMFIILKKESKMKQFLIRWDNLTEQPHNLFHVNSTDQHKSYRGGAISLMAIICVLYLAGRNGNRLVTKHKPDIRSVNKGISIDHDHLNKAVYLNTTNKMFL